MQKDLDYSYITDIKTSTEQSSSTFLPYNTEFKHVKKRFSGWWNQQDSFVPLGLSTVRLSENWAYLFFFKLIIWSQKSIKTFKGWLESHGFESWHLMKFLTPGCHTGLGVNMVDGFF